MATCQDWSLWSWSRLPGWRLAQLLGFGSNEAGPCSFLPGEACPASCPSAQVGWCWCLGLAQGLLPGAGAKWSRCAIGHASVQLYTSLLGESAGCHMGRQLLQPQGVSPVWGQDLSQDPAGARHPTVAGGAWGVLQATLE